MAKHGRGRSHQDRAQTSEARFAQGGRLQRIPAELWAPTVTAVSETMLAAGQDPMVVISADGTGGATELPTAGFFRLRR